MARLAVNLLGPMRVMLDGAPVEHFGYDKVRALLAYLAVERGLPQRREMLAELLWPEQSAGVARTNLRRALSTLRHALGESDDTPLLHTDRDSVALNASCNVDVAGFLALLDACAMHRHTPGELCTACAERRERAVNLYHGDFLALFALPDSAAFDEWTLVLRERLHEQAADALARLAAYYEARGDDQRAREVARRWVDLARWDEEAHRFLMRLFERTGQREAALAQYVRCRRLLADELGIAPASETVALYEIILAGRTSTASLLEAPRKQSNPSAPPLPAPASPLIDRERELRELDALLADLSARLITLSGPPGVGKTRLAFTVAERCRQPEGRFPDGVWLASLAPIQEPARVADACLQAVGLPTAPGRSPAESLAAFFGPRRALLLLDNFEQVLGTAPLLSELLAAAPGLVILVTSRVVLRLSGEYEYAVAPLANAGWPAAARYPAVQLFAARAAATDHNFVLTERNIDATSTICRRLDGLLLAIDLAAARTRVLDPVDLLERLERGGLAALPAGPRDLPERQRTLRDAIAWSYDLLSSQEQQLLRRLGVFVRGFDVVAAESLAETRTPAIDLLAALVDQSLVTATRDGLGMPRFTLLEMIRAFALERLAEQHELEDVRERHAAYYMRLGEELEPAMFDERQLAALDRLEAERENFTAAIDWSLATAAQCGDNESDMLGTALRLARGISWLWLYRGSQVDGLRRLRQALVAGRKPTRARARALGAAASLASLNSELDLAERMCEEELAIGQSLGHQLSVCHALFTLSLTAWSRGDMRRAITYADECLAVSEHLGECQRAMALFQRGRVAAVAGDGVRGRASLEDALARMRAVGATWQIADILLNLGLAAFFSGDLQQAREHFMERLELWRKARAYDTIPSSLVNLAEISWLEGRYDEVKTLIQELATMWRDIGASVSLGLTLPLLARVALEQGDYPRVEEICAESLAIGRKLDHPGIVARALHIRGLARLARGDDGGARSDAMQVLPAARAYGDRDTILFALSLAGLVAAYCADNDTARIYLAERRTIVEGLSRQDEWAELYAETGHVALAAGALDEAATLLTESAAILDGGAGARCVGARTIGGRNGGMWRV